MQLPPPGGILGERGTATRGGRSFSRTDRRQILKRVRNAALYVIKYTHARNIAPLATTDASMIVILRRGRERGTYSAIQRLGAKVSRLAIDFGK